jgi:hypothetical protein
LLRPRQFLFLLLLPLAPDYLSGQAEVSAPENLPGQAPLSVIGYSVPGIDFTPLQAIFAKVTRGGVEEASVEITNRRPTPLKIAEIVNPSQRFTARVETVEEGRRFRLTVTLKGEGQAGKQQQILELKTNLEDAPVLRIPVNTFVTERVRTFPDSVFMGRYPISEIRGKPDSAKGRAQTLMVYREGTKDFEITVSSDVPYLRISSERGPNGDRYENTIWIDPDLAQPGKIQGNILIQTNDPEFPKLTVPVWGDLQAK